MKTTIQNKFRCLKNNEHALRDLCGGYGQIFLHGNIMLDTDYLLNLYHEILEATAIFDQERAKLQKRKDALLKQAQKLGAVIHQADFEGDKPIPAPKEMENATEHIRLAYLTALLAKNFHLFVKAADQGSTMTHVREDETKTASNYGRSWTFVVRHDTITVPCDEHITNQHAYVRDDMEVLEWNGSGYDREGDWQDTGFPSKWNTHVWRLPKSIKVLTDMVWKNSKIKIDNPYQDFRNIFFSTMCGGSGNGSGEHHDSLYPRVWDRFGVNSNEAQHQFPLSGIEWNDRLHVTKLVFNLREDGQYIGKPKDLPRQP